MDQFQPYEGSKVWKAVGKGLRDLEKDGLINMKVERRFVIGYLSKVLIKKHVAQHSKGTRKVKAKKKENNLSPPVPCNAQISLGCPHICQLPAGHEGKHRKMGNAGLGDRPIPYCLEWDGDFRFLYGERLCDTSEKD